MNRLFFLILALLFVILLPLPSVHAASRVEQEFAQAKEGYQRQVKTVKWQKYRDRWQSVIAELQGFVRRHPDHARAAEALYLAACAEEGMYKVSRLPDDARRAVQLFDKLVERYKRSDLLEAALYRAAQLYEHPLGESAHAYHRYAQMLDRYPVGKWAETARGRLRALAAFAPSQDSRSRAPSPSGEVVIEGTAGVTLSRIRSWSNPGYTRVVIDLSRQGSFSFDLLPAEPANQLLPRLYIDLADTTPAVGLPEIRDINDGLLRQVRTGRPEPGRTRVVLDLLSFNDYKVFTLPEPFRIVVDITGVRTAPGTGLPVSRPLPVKPQLGKSVVPPVEGESRAYPVVAESLLPPAEPPTGEPVRKPQARPVVVSAASLPVTVTPPPDPPSAHVLPSARVEPTHRPKPLPSLPTTGIAEPVPVASPTLAPPPAPVVAVLPPADTEAARPAPPSAVDLNTADGITRLLDAAPVEPASPLTLPPTGESGVIRKIAVDAGHGGKDPGAIGPSGVMEKDVTLAMARYLARRITKELGLEVVLTRDEDVFIPLEERTAIANKVGADLFVSIHANASTTASVHGIETYYLNFSKNEKAAAVAARENGTSLKQVGDLELILFDLMAHSKIQESSRLASIIQRSLVDDLARHYNRIKDLGVRQGPFYVLLGANMPSVLVEAAFISNRSEESRLASRRYQERAADAILEGIRNFTGNPKLVAER